MKPADFIVRIPEPCHEDWNKMQPDAKGKFCSSCSKSVFDFSNKTDLEIKTILIEHKHEQVCGHFKKTQVDRPLNIRVDLNNLPKNMSATKTFALALFLIFGSLLFSCKDERGTDIPIQGMVLPENNKGITTKDLPPPVKDSSVCEIMMTGEPEMPVDTPLVYVSEHHVAGGIRYIPQTVEDPPPVIPVEEVPVLKEQYIDGRIAYHPIDTSGVTPVDSALTNNIQKNDKQQIHNKLKVFSVYPNPTTGEFTIRYDVIKRSDVKITIFNTSGALVRNVVNMASQYEGQYRVPVNLNELSNGIYIVSFINNGTQSTERLVIAR